MWSLLPPHLQKKRKELNNLLWTSDAHLALQVIDSTARLVLSVVVQDRIGVRSTKGSLYLQAGTRAPLVLHISTNLHKRLLGKLHRPRGGIRIQISLRLAQPGRRATETWRTAKRRGWFASSACWASGSGECHFPTAACMLRHPHLTTVNWAELLILSAGQRSIIHPQAN